VSLLDTKHEKKSFTITVVLHVLLILILLFFGLQYLDPPPENGIAINFGTSDVGSGDKQPTEAIKSAPQKSAPPVVAQPKTQVEEVVTQESEEAPVIQKKAEKKPVVQEQKVEPKKLPPAKKPDPTPDKSTTDAMSSILNGPKSDGTAAGGEGNDRVAGDKGSRDGDPNASAYYGNGSGLDGDGNYRLGGRKALNKEKIPQDCNEAGLVVVKITVNQNGQVISASPGQRGTTNTATCLTEPARKAAMATRFNSDSNAPSVQTGYITYNFKLSE